MQDLKAGQIVGATPFKQQIMQIVGVAAAAVCIAPVLQLLFSAYGLGDVFPREGMNAAEALKAPQATLMSSVAIGVLLRNLPWIMIGIGAAIAVAIIITDKVLESRGSEFRTPVLAVAVGIYLPLELSVPIFVGGMVSYFAGRAMKARSMPMDQQKMASRQGLLFASGLITGEALVGILLAIPFAAFQDTGVLALPVGESYAPVAQGLGIAAFVGFSAWLYRAAQRAE
jgi:putative OPT family oligopeptide transporter